MCYRHCCPGPLKQKPSCATLPASKPASKREVTHMAHNRVSGVRSVELGVRDLRQSADFYNKVWALEEVASDTGTIHFRATGAEHHVLTIHRRKKPAVLVVHFAAPD